MNDLMKIQLEKEFLEHVLEYLSSKEKIDEAVVARGSIKSNNGRMTTNDYFDVDGNSVGHVQLDLGRFNERTMRDVAGIERALSMRERLILESVFAMSKQRVAEDHKELLPHMDDKDPSLKMKNKDFINHLPRLCGSIVENSRETGFKSQGSFSVNEEMLKKINELRQKKDNVYQILKADVLSDITDTLQKLEKCIDKKSWAQYFVKDYQSPQASISPTIGFFSSQSRVTKENSMIRLAELLKSFSDKPGDYDSERLKAALKELVHACRARSLAGNSKTADSIEKQFSGLLSEPVLSVGKKN